MGSESASTGSLDSRLSNIETTMNSLLSKNSDPSSPVRSRVTRLRNGNDLRAWLRQYDRNNEFFRVHIDFHVLMEHVHRSLTGYKLLETLIQCKEIGLRTAGEAIVISSFDHVIPRLFSGNNNAARQHGLIDLNTSCFKEIPSYEHFVSFKDLFRRELWNFAKAHQRLIERFFEKGTELHKLASQSLTESTTFAEGLVNYMDKTFKAYSAAGALGTDKSWHLTTLLASRLIEFVGHSRSHAPNGMAIGDTADINDTLTMAIFRSIDKMKHMTNLKFENVPCVHIELAKFFFKVVSPEAIETLQATAEELKEDLAEMKQINNSREAAEVLHQQIQMKNQVDALVDGVAIMKRFLADGDCADTITPSLNGAKLQAQFLCIYRWQQATTQRKGRSDSFDTADLDLSGI